MSIDKPEPNLSERGYIWSPRTDKFPELLEAYDACEQTPFIARLLAGRGVVPEQAEPFLHPKLKNHMPDPSTLADMDKAVDEIWSAIDAKKSITVFADYDVDGATSAAQLIRWAGSIGADFGLYVPDRVKEGYGPSVEAFKTLKLEGVDTVITVDCGAAAEAPLKAAEGLGLDIIVIDHHQMSGTPPPCLALVNPNRPDDTSGLGDLAAAGVVFMLLVALNRDGRRRKKNNLPDLTSFLPLSMLGTICDVVPLKGLNRAITRQGLGLLPQSDFVGLEALASISGKVAPFKASDMGFGLGPRINAGGRIGEADMGARLLTSDDGDAANTMAETLNRVNGERQLMQKHMLEEALAQASQMSDDKPVIITAMEGWHPGIIGIVAGRLKDQFDRPALVIGFNHNDIGKGSGRSIDGVDLGSAIIEAKMQGLVAAGGGHAMAAGLTVHRETFAAFCGFIEDYLAKDVAVANLNRSLTHDGTLSAAAINVKTLEIIDQLEPFGRNNPSPVFIIENVSVAYSKRLNGGHVKCSFQDSHGVSFGGICFGAEDKGLADILLSPNPPRVDISCQIKRNEWQGRVSTDVHVQDIRKTAVQ
ncbi:MAG: single-stranded-DNA-specific exonuclease RecJ [Maricaulaceae bacterium]